MEDNNANNTTDILTLNWQNTYEGPFDKAAIETLVAAEQDFFKERTRNLLERALDIMQDPRAMPWSWPAGNHFRYYLNSRYIDNRCIDEIFDYELWTPPEEILPAAHQIWTYLDNYVSSKPVGLELIVDTVVSDDVEFYLIVAGYELRDFRLTLRSDDRGPVLSWCEGNFIHDVRPSSASEIFMESQLIKHIYNGALDVLRKSPFYLAKKYERTLKGITAKIQTLSAI